MCLPAKNDQPDASAPGPRAIAGLSALMLVAGVAVLALALCAVRALLVALRRRQSGAGHGS